MTPSPKGYYVRPGSVSDPEAYPLTKVDHALDAQGRGQRDRRRRASSTCSLTRRGPGQATLPPGFVPFPGLVVVPPSTTTTSSTTTTTIPTGTTIPTARGSRRRRVTRRSSGTGTGVRGAHRPELTDGKHNSNGDTTAHRHTQAAHSSARVTGSSCRSSSVLGILALLYLLGDLACRRGPRSWRRGHQGQARRRRSGDATPAGGDRMTDTETRLTTDELDALLVDLEAHARPTPEPRTERPGELRGDGRAPRTA